MPISTLARITRFSLRKKHRRSVLTAKILPTLVVASAAYAISVLYPAPVLPTSHQRIFTEGLRIELDRSSPAFAAMEDAILGTQLTEFDSVITPENGESVEMLAAGHASAVGIVDMIARENRREAALLAQAKMAREAQERMVAQAAADAFAQMAQRFAMPAKSETSTSANANSASAPKTTAANAQNNLDGAPNSKALQAAASGVADAYHERQAAPVIVEKTIHLSDIGMSREQFMREFFMPLATADVGDTDTGMMVAAQALPRGRRQLASDRLGGLSSRRTRLGSGLVDAGSGASARRNGLPGAGRAIFGGGANPTSSRDGLEAESVHLQAATPASGATHGAASGATETDLNSTPAAAPGVHQLTMAGQFEFSDGLALTSPSDTVVIYRENDGVVFESAAVWLKKASYEIFMERAEGDLVAELRTPHGDLLGQARLDLGRLIRANSAQSYRLDNVNMKIRPVPQGVSGQVMALNKTPLAGAQVQFESLPLAVATAKSGRFEAADLMEGSFVSLQIQHPGFVATRAAAFAGQNNEAVLLAEKSLEQLRALQQSPHDHSTAMIMGRVTRSGSPVSGAQVEIATEGEARKVIYFNSKLMPDASLEATTENGLYVVDGISNGLHQVIASWGPAVSEPVMVTAENDVLEQANLEIAMSQSSKLGVFDAFRTDWPLAAQIRKPGSDPFLVPRTGSGEIKYGFGQNALTLDADAGENYETVRVTTDRNHKSIFIPMLQSAWLDQARGALRLTREPHAGTVVGFIQGVAPFEVSMDEKSLGSSSKLVYFNSRGEISDKNVGEPGGGFIIFNLPEGSRSILVQAQGMSKGFAATILVESRVTNVINHWMR